MPRAILRKSEWMELIQKTVDRKMEASEMRRLLSKALLRRAELTMHAALRELKKEGVIKMWPHDGTIYYAPGRMAGEAAPREATAVHPASTIVKGGIYPPIAKVAPPIASVNQFAQYTPAYFAAMTHKQLCDFNENILPEDSAERRAYYDAYRQMERERPRKPPDPQQEASQAAVERERAKVAAATLRTEEETTKMVDDFLAHTHVVAKET